MKKFREVLQRSLEAGEVQLPEGLLWEYDDIQEAYRVVRITSDKTEITPEDFDAQAEKPQIVCRSDFDRSDIGNYGCSFFDNVDMINIVLHMPRKNRRIAKGAIRQEFGPIIIDGAHIMCFLYSDAHMETEFEVI